LPAACKQTDEVMPHSANSIRHGGGLCSWHPHNLRRHVRRQRDARTCASWRGAAVTGNGDEPFPFPHCLLSSWYPSSSSPRFFRIMRLPTFSGHRIDPQWFTSIFFTCYNLRGNLPLDISICYRAASRFSQLTTGHWQLLFKELSRAALWVRPHKETRRPLLAFSEYCVKRPVGKGADHIGM